MKLTQLLHGGLYSINNQHYRYDEYYHEFIPVDGTDIRWNLAPVMKTFPSSDTEVYAYSDIDNWADAQDKVEPIKLTEGIIKINNMEGEFTCHNMGHLWIWHHNSGTVEYTIPVHYVHDVQRILYHFSQFSGNEEWLEKADTFLSYGTLTEDMSDEECERSWKESFPKNLLSHEDFNKVAEMRGVTRIKFIKDCMLKKGSGYGLKSAAIYNDLWMGEVHES